MSQIFSHSGRSLGRKKRNSHCCAPKPLGRRKQSETEKETQPSRLSRPQAFSSLHMHMCVGDPTSRMHQAGNNWPDVSRLAGSPRLVPLRKRSPDGRQRRISPHWSGGRGEGRTSTLQLPLTSMQSRHLSPASASTDEPMCCACACAHPAPPTRQMPVLGRSDADGTFHGPWQLALSSATCD